jgi:putative transposase
MAQNNDTKIFEKMLLQFSAEQDPLLAMLKWLMQKLMEIESSVKVGAPKGTHSKERNTYFTGTRVRRFDTRLGTVYLLVPKLRKGGYIPFFVTEKKRSEQALIQVVQEAFINGVSIRKIERLAIKSGIENISASQVSEINKELDEQVKEFRLRQLDKEYPVIWIDELYEKIRDNNRVRNIAVCVVSGLNLCDIREIIAVEPVYHESEETYIAVFRSLKSRGVEKVWLCVYDAHLGLQAAIRKEFLGCIWQRCKVHLMRNLLAHITKNDKERVALKLKQIWKQPDMASAEKYSEMFISEFEKRFPTAIDILENGLEDYLHYYHFSCFDARKISSTNILERLNVEIRRRSRVIGVFPSIDSYVRLVTCYLIEYSEDWSSGICYINQSSIE